MGVLLRDIGGKLGPEVMAPSQAVSNPVRRASKRIEQTSRGPQETKLPLNLAGDAPEARCKS